MEDFFSSNSSENQPSDADQRQIIGWDADVDHSQIIGGDTAKLLGGIYPTIHPGFWHPWFWADLFGNLQGSFEWEIGEGWMPAK